MHATSRWGAAARRTLIAGLLAASTALTTSGAGQAEVAIRTRYLCKGQFDATEVTALFFNDRPSEVVLLTGSEGATRLLQGPSGSGARYVQGDDVFWIKGDQATWQQGRARALQCEVSSGPGFRGPTR
jgi:membrane-bound inhibitor of C-type lysozyme